MKVFVVIAVYLLIASPALLLIARRLKFVSRQYKE